MGYNKEKIKVENKMKRIKTVALWIVVFIVVGLSVFAQFYPAQEWKYYVDLPKLESREKGTLRLHFLDVGKGDCSLIEFPDGKTMLVDGGDGSERTATTILRYLNALKIKKIDYLLLTHADSDHCGSLDTLVKQKEIGLAYIPKVQEDVNTQYAEFYAAMVEKGYPMKYTEKSAKIPVLDERYPFTFAFLYPYTSDIENTDKLKESDNEFSAVFWLDYFGSSALFMGDAPFSTENKILEAELLGLNTHVELSDTEILKVAHHGSRDSTSEALLEYLNAETAMISCGKDNLYGHPSDEVCMRLLDFGVKDYRTYRDGHIIVTMRMDGTYSVSTLAP